MKSNLPAGWESSTLATVASIVRGIAFPAKDKAYNPSPDHIACLRTANVQKKVRWDDLWFIPKSYVRDEKQVVCTGDILISLANSYELVGKVSQVQDIPTPSTLGAFISLIRAKGEIDKSYLYYYLNSNEVQSAIRKLASTTVNISNVSVGKISDLKVLLPPLAEQHRIVAQLEATMQKLEASQERLEKLPVLLKKFRQAVLAAAVSGKLTEAWRAEQPQVETGAKLLNRIQKERREWAIQEARKGNLEASRFYKKAEAQSATTTEDGLPEGWAKASLLKVCQLVVDCHNKTAPYISEGIPLVRTTNIKNGRLLLDSVKYVSPETYKFWSRRCPPQPGDILFTREAPMGESAIIPPDTTLCMGQRMMLLRFFKGLSEVQFFGYVIQSPSFLSQLGENAVGTGVLHLRVGDVEALQVPVPPLAEQQEIARQVNHYFELADQLEARFEQAAALVEQLPQALLAKAFSGQLVLQDPNDEPASALLERLEAETTTSPNGKRRNPKVASGAPLFE
ncbi:restriction endonuclease subunit S [Hymenobacter sp. BT730]|uniref:restriction endonuclease subunit S n=1 Tax=Hymenobacter sp. BT730 TaxID=3063332 RepID=UPI0026E10C0E|nr:restriction endonuclease subunit S [Hymenobacter sp. BT730]